MMAGPGSPLWTAVDVAAATGGRLWPEPAGAGWSASGVSIDSRTLAPGDLFIALQGPNFDGHAFIGAAFVAGAAAAIATHVPQAMHPAGPLVVVADTMAALAALGRAGRGRTQAKVIAVTGSVGKTGTKEALRIGLAAQAPTFASRGNLNNQWGVPLSLAQMPPDVAYGIFELGMNHAGEIAPLAAQVRPDVAVITTVDAVHLEFFDSVEAIADAKAEIFVGMSPGGAAVLNRDNPHFERLRRAAQAQRLQVVGFGRDSRAEARLIDCSLHATCSAVAASILGERLDYSLPVPGLHLVLNSLAVLAAAKLAGADAGTAAAALAKLSPIEGRGRRCRIALPGGSFELIDESYNASPVAMGAAIAVLGQTRPGAGGRRIAVLGDMLELGREGPRLHAELAESLAAAEVDLVFAAGPLMASLFAALPLRRRGAHAGDSAGVLPQILQAVRPGDVVLVKGSLGSRMAVIVAGLRQLETTGAPGRAEAVHAH